MNHWPIAGHERAVRQLQLAVENDELPHALLITGPEQVGKSTLARTVAQALLCTASQQQRPCGSCSACRRVVSGNHPDLLLVAPESEGQRLKIEQIRELERYLSLTPTEGRYKLAIVFAFEEATASAANALLKTLEEPPPYAHLVLLATDADTLLPTIVSRVQHLLLRPLNPQTVAHALQERWQLAKAESERLAQLSGGRLGWAVNAAAHPEVLQAMEQALDSLVELLHSDLPTRFEHAERLAKDDLALAQLLEYWRNAWRDVLLLQTQNAARILYQEREAMLWGVATELDIATTQRVLHALGESLAALAKYANTRLVVESLFLELPYLRSPAPR